MTAPFEKAKLAGYVVEKVEGPGVVAGWDAVGPDDVALNPATLYATEIAAWEACDNHRLFGHVLGPRGELRAAGYDVKFARPDAGAWFERVDGQVTVSGPVRDTEADAWADAEADLKARASRFPPIPPAPSRDEPATYPPQADALAQTAVRLDTRRVVCASTSNLTLATCAMLSEPGAKWPVYGGLMPDGFYICATARAESEGAPEELRNVLAWARDNGFDYVQFDTDADPLADLPTFDHDPRPPVDALEAFAKVRALFATWEGWSAHADGYDPAELLAAIAEAVGAELNGKPAAPVTDTLAEKMERYNDALGDLGISPNGDDFNALLDFAVGQPYREPHEKGR